MSTHVYQALEGPKHIRLIAVHPASSKEEPLKVAFLSSTLGDFEGRYEAISYTWGEPILEFPLYVDDGTQICVTQNLDRALRYLRRSDRDRLLWADAASINQADNAEKAVQIPMMVQIFRGAHRVLAWLDSGGDTSIEQRGMRTIDHLSRANRNERTESNADFGAVMRFLNLPWFNRLWVVQEIVFSLEVNLICGDTEITFLRLISALPVIQKGISLLGTDDRVRVDAMATIESLWTHHSLFGTRFPRHFERDSKDIISLVETFTSYACTDPRDRIYALFSMAANVQPAGYTSDNVGLLTSHKEGLVSLNIDYSLNVRETYKEFAVSCWKEKQMHAGMWDALLMRQHSSRADDWPSWVPDWRVLPKKTLPIEETIFRDFFRIISVTRSGICLETVRERPLPCEDNVPPYTVRSKISRQSVGSGHSIESQLHQLCIVAANGSEIARNPDTSTDERQRPSWMSYTTRFPDLLYSSIIKCPLQLNIDSGLTQDEPHGDLLQRLIEYLSSVMTGTKEGDSRYRHTSTTIRRRDHIHDFKRASKDFSNLFVFQDPCTQLNSIGYGDVAPEVGDFIVPMGDTLLHEPVRGITMVIILRRVCSKDRSIADPPTYRFIGSGCIFDPLVVLLRLQDESFSFRDCEYVSHKFNIV